MDAERCPCCGTLRATPADPLLAACDVLVLRALELVGMRIVRARSVPGDRRVREEQGRLRYAKMREDGRPFHDAHVMWRAYEDDIDGGLATAWDTVGLVLAEYGCCGASPEQVTAALDRYCRDLLVVGQSHDPAELRYRLGLALGVPA